MLSTPSTLPFFCAHIPASTSSRRIEQSLSFADSWHAVSPLIWWLYSSEQHSVHLPMISCSSARHFPCLSWMVLTFDYLCCVRSFMSWASTLAVVFAELRFYLCALFLYPFFFCHVHAFPGSYSCSMSWAKRSWQHPSLSKLDHSQGPPTCRVTLVMNTGPLQFILEPICP